MTIDFTCQKCDASFEIDVQDLIDGSEKLVCTSCETKAPPSLVEDFVAALTEMRTQVAALGKKFSLAMAFETEDLEDLDAKDAEEDDLDDEDDDLDDDDEDAADDEDQGR
jgi:phosphopantothenoylcysteine synthetase/decarboxylase